MQKGLGRRDRSCLENRRKGGDASLPDEPDVLEQQPHWSGNRGIDYHQLREGSGGGYQNQRKGDAFLPPSNVNPSAMDTDPRQGRGGYGGSNNVVDGDIQSHTNDDDVFMIHPSHVAGAGRGGLYTKCNGRNSSEGERQQQKRGDCNSPPHLIQHAGVSPKFPGRERGDYFNSGGFESRSSRVWSKEKDRGGASPPVGKSSSSLLDCQNLKCKDENSWLERRPLQKRHTFGREGFSVQNPTSSSHKYPSSHHHEVDCPFDSSGGFRRSQHINSDTAIAPCTLGPSSCTLERGDGVRGGGAGTCSVKQSHFSEPKARTPTEELSSKPPPSVCSPPSQDRSYARNYERGYYRGGRKWDRERGPTSGRKPPSRYNTPYHPSLSDSQLQSSGYPSPRQVSSETPSLDGSSSQPEGEGSRHMLRETDSKPATTSFRPPINLPDKINGGGDQRRGWKERDFASQSPHESSTYKSPMSEWVGGSSSPWGGNRQGMGKASCKSPHSSRSDRSQLPNNMLNRHHQPRRFNPHHSPGKGRNKLDYYGPSLNRTPRSDLGVERGEGFSKGSGGYRMPCEGDKYSGYSTNGDFRYTRGIGTSSNSTDNKLRHDPPPNPKEASSGSNNFYFREDWEQGASVPETTAGAFWSEQKPQHSDRGVIRNENSMSRAVHEHQQPQIPLRQPPWQSSMRNFPSKRSLSGTDFPDSTKGRSEPCGDMPELSVKLEWPMVGDEEKIHKFESSQLSGGTVASYLEETDQGGHEERAYILQEMEEGECTLPGLVSSHSVTRQSYSSIAEHDEQERPSSLPPPPPTVDEISVLPPSLRTPSRSLFDEDRGCVETFQKEITSSNTINAVQSEAVATVAPHQSSHVSPPTASSLVLSTPTSSIPGLSSPLPVTQPQLRRGLLHLIGTSSSSASYSSPKGLPTACEDPQDSSMPSVPSPDVLSYNKPPMAPNPLENVSTSLESDGVTKPAGQQKPARLSWGMSLNRASNSERTTPSPPPSLLPWATTASKEGVETEDEKKTTHIEKEKVVNNNEPGSQGSAKLDQVNGGSRSPITPGSDSGPKRLSWGMSLRRPAVVEKMRKSSNDDSPRCHTTPVVSSFSEVENGKVKLLDDSALKQGTTHPTTRSDIFDSAPHPVKTKTGKCNEMGDGGGEEGERLKLIAPKQQQLGSDVDMPCKRKKEKVKQQQEDPPQKFIKMDHHSVPSLTSVKSETKEVVGLLSHQPPLLPTHNVISTKQESSSSSMLHNSPGSTIATYAISGGTGTIVSRVDDNATVLSASGSQQLHDEHSVEVIPKSISKDMDVAIEDSVVLPQQPKVIRKKKQRMEEFRGVVKSQTEKRAKQQLLLPNPPTIIPPLRMDTVMGVKEKAEAETETTTAVEMGQQQQQGPLSMVTSPLHTPSEKVSKKKVSTPRGTRELASLTEKGNTLYVSTPRRGSKLGTTSASHTSSKNLSKLGTEGSIGSKGAAIMTPMGTATKRPRHSAHSSTVDKEDIQWGDNSTSSSPWDPFVSAGIGGASTIRIGDVIKTPEGTKKAMEALQYLRFLEGHRKDVICRVATPYAPLPLPHVFQSALGKVKMKLREIDRQLTYKGKELDAQQRRKENKMLFDEVSCDSMTLDAKVWNNPVSLVEAISKAKAVRHMLLAWSEQFPQIKQPHPQYPYSAMKNSLQGPSTTTKMQTTTTTSSNSLSIHVNALYRHSEDMESVAKLLTYNRCLAMAAHSASTVHQHCVNCTLPHQKRQLMATSPELASRVAKAVLRRKKDVIKKLESLGNEYAMQQSKWKSRVSILEKRENKEETASSKGNWIRDCVRSDYEQEQMLVEIMAKEAKQLKMDNGCTSPPDMLTVVERSQLQEVSFGSIDAPWNTSDGERMLCEDFPWYQSCPPGCNCFRTMEKNDRMENPWTDREKCIFIQQFLVHPKDFYAISRYLPNKQTHDVVCFYYDTKQYVDYKEVLKEHTQRAREKTRGIVIEGGVTGRWPATLSAANCMGTVISLLDPSDPTSLTFELPREGLYRTLHAHPPVALASMPDLKREALELSRKGVVRKIQAPLGLKGLKSDVMTTNQLDGVDVSATTLNLVAYHLALSLCPTIGRDPPPFRRSRRDVAYVNGGSGSPGGFHLWCGVFETTRGGTGGRGRGSKLRDGGDCLFGRSYNKDSDEANPHLFFKNQSSIGSNGGSSSVSNTSSSSCQSLRRVNRPFLSPSLPPDNSEKVSVSSSGSRGGDVIRSGGQKWREEEKEAFLSHFNQVGKDWLALAKAIPGKATNQIKNYYQNYKVKLGLVEPLIKSNTSNGNCSDRNAITNVNTKTEDEVKNATKQPPSLCSSTEQQQQDGNQQPLHFTTEGAVGSSAVVALDSTTHRSSAVSGDNGRSGNALVDNLNGHTTFSSRSPFCNTTAPRYSSTSHGGGDDGHKLDREGNPTCVVASESSQLCSVAVDYPEQKQQYHQPNIVKAEGDEDHHAMPPILPSEGNNDRCSYTGGERQQNTDSLSVGGGGGVLVTSTTAQDCCASMSLLQCSNIPAHQQEGGDDSTLKLDED